MNYFKFILFFCLVSAPLSAQQLTGDQLLDKAIAYHDPNGNWVSFEGSMNVTMETPTASPRMSAIKWNLPQEYFSVTATKDSIQTTYTIDKGKCQTSITDSIPGKRTPCETAQLYKNYYTYLYGLPMKLKDPGTHISEEVEKRSFKGTDYYVLKVTYDAAVGTDVWFFYFNPETYAMEVYQFFKGDPTGEGKNTGEYILLTEEVTINGIKFPKDRAWYYNKDDKFLGVDLLQIN